MLDSDIANYLGSPAPLPPLTPDMLTFVRQGLKQSGTTLPAPQIDTVRDLNADDVPMRLYRPAGEELLPLLVFLHGGGWMLGDLDTHDAMHRQLAERAHCAVLGVGYRLAPEHPFPAALDDVVTAWQWARRQSANLGCDPERLAIGGESAGGNLAAAATLKLRQTGEQQPLFQLLVHPATDLRLGLPSLDEVAAHGLDRDYLSQCVAMYTGKAALTDPLVSPLCAENHKDLPPAVILTAEEDPLRDDGEYYARALAASGVETLCRRLMGLPHGFMFLPETIPAISRSFDTIADLLRRYFAVR